MQLFSSNQMHKILGLETSNDLLMISLFLFTVVSSPSLYSLSISSLHLNPKKERTRTSEMSSPGRSRGGEKEQRARTFDTEAKKMCWAKAETVPGRHPERWRKDSAGNVVCKRFANCQGCLCFEYDHIIPFSKGGESIAENCQILQTRVNRLKANKDEIDISQLKSYSCDIKFTDKELDVIEMAVYGDVIRPGNQCRCRTVAELLGQYKSKDRAAPCKLP
ncbi:uncharacterized protein LOC107772071 [Nicotiana tabacum]|uniref:Uncharacterized protein LOC107772071 n=1 Tax=Nicotiana tabacum TaxID=4097 RepID=A0A1S3Y4F1_TOBAC|nr:PREDICTED: uncharacterized protein LOC107772071 [Nicotiana tabacum]